MTRRTLVSPARRQQSLQATRLARQCLTLSKRISALLQTAARSDRAKASEIMKRVADLKKRADALQAEAERLTRLAMDG